MLNNQNKDKMLSHNNFKYLTLALFFLFALNEANFAVTQDISASQAIQLFDDGEFETAGIAFRNLLNEDPDNPMLNYYYAASLTENGHYSNDVLNFFSKAGKSVTPQRFYYYLGVQHHALNQWEEALKYYNQFRVSVPVKEQEELELNRKIQQCYNQVNPFEKAGKADLAPVPEKDTVIPGVRQPEKITASSSEKPQEKSESTQPAGLKPGKEDVLSGSKPEKKKLLVDIPRKNLPDLPGVKPTYALPSGEPVDFQINNTITYLNTAHFKTAEGKALFLKGDSLRDKLELTRQKTDALRDNYHSVQDEEEQARLGKIILANENESYRLQEEIHRLFSQSRAYENNYWQKAGEIRQNNFMIELEKMRAAMHYDEGQDQEPETRITSDALLLMADDLFESNTGQTDQPTSSSLVYKIQIGAYSRGVPAYMKRLFDKLSLIREIEHYTDEEGVVVYTTGNLTRLEDAIKMQNQVRQEGIKDAYVVPYFNRKRITLDQAKEIEKRHEN